MASVPAVRNMQHVRTPPWAFVVNAARRLTREQARLALAFGVGWGSSFAILMWGLYPAYPAWKPIANAFLWALALVAPLLLAMVLAESCARTRAPHWIPYAVAAVAATLIGSTLGTAGERLLGLDCCYDDGRVPPAWQVFLYGVFNNLLVCGLAVLAYVHRKTALARTAALRAVQLERADLVKRTQESRLQAMQARVEPQFLFNTLAQVERLYETEPERADRMLDDLIVYLRAALPELRKTTSTLAKEIELARAYLNIVNIRLGDRLAIEITIPDDAQELRFPPMVLLPLIDHAIVSRDQATSAPGTIRIIAVAANERLHVDLRHDGDVLVADDSRDEGLGNIRDRLRALYGEHTRIESNARSGTETHIVVEIPCERG